MQGGVFSIDRAYYFDLTGGRERWLYRVARKHAEGAGEAGFAISMPTLFEKLGAEGQYSRFKFEIAKIAERDELPGYALSIETPAGKREPNRRMRRRADSERPLRSVTDTAAAAKAPPAPAPTPTARPKARAPEADDTVDVGALIRRTVTTAATRATAGEITDATLATLRAECPGWDHQTLHADFRAWIEADSVRTPVSYQAAFIGDVRRFDEKHRHKLGRR